MVSVIIPTYNEESTIQRLLKSLSSDNVSEVIVADGGSSDRTKELAQQYPVKVIECVKNRALQMNEGARQAEGNTFLFLHADSILENNSFNPINQNINKGFIGGCYSQRIDSSKIIYRLIESSGNIRAKLSKIFYGDQAIFVRKDIFSKIGGFDLVDIFEDVLFSKKLKRIGRTTVLSQRVLNSPRRWEKQGIIKATLIYWFLSVGFILRVPFRILKKIYNDVR